MPKFIYINNKVVKFIDQFTWYKLTNGLSNFHNFYTFKICNEKEHYINIKWEMKGRFCTGASALEQLCCFPGPVQYAFEAVCKMGLLTVYSCSPNCALSVLLILWLRLACLSAQAIISKTFLEWQSCLKPKMWYCQFQLRILLSGRRLG